MWTFVAAVAGAYFIFFTHDQGYRGDAYELNTNTGAQTVRALGWLILSTGPVGLIVALSRRD